MVGCCVGLKRCLLKCCCCCCHTPRYEKAEQIDLDVATFKSSDTLFYYQVVEGIKRAALDRASTTFVDGKITTKNYYVVSPDDHLGEEIAMKDYCPGVFRKLRQQDGIDTDSFIESWNLAPEDIKVKKGAGRSGSLFLFSKDHRFLFKTIPYHEYETLLAILFNFANYLGHHANSRLMRFYALHRFRIQNQFYYVVVGNNCLNGPENLNVTEKFDLKGRAIKPSSEKKKGYLDKANDGIWKDNQLSRVRLGSKPFIPHNAASLCSILIKDAEFLASQGCIDYSLLVGVHKSDKPITTVLLEEHTRKHKEDLETKAAELKRTGTAGLMRAPTAPKPATSTDPSTPVAQLNDPNMRYSFINVSPTYGVGMPSADRKEVYFVGIIDFLSRYFLKKKIANRMKRFLWTPAQLSTVPPPFYLQRFKEYIPTIICDAEEGDFEDSEQEEPGCESKEEESTGTSADGGNHVKFHIPETVSASLAAGRVITPKDIGFEKVSPKKTKENNSPKAADARANGDATTDGANGGSHKAEDQAVMIHGDGDGVDQDEVKVTVADTTDKTQ